MIHRWRYMRHGDGCCTESAHDRGVPHDLYCIMATVTSVFVELANATMLFVCVRAARVSGIDQKEPLGLHMEHWRSQSI